MLFVILFLSSLVITIPALILALLKSVLLGKSLPLSILLAFHPTPKQRFLVSPRIHVIIRIPHIFQLYHSLFLLILLLWHKWRKILFLEFELSLACHWRLVFFFCVRNVLMPCLWSKKLITVFTFFAFAVFCAFYSSFEAFAVVFSAVGFLAVAATFFDESLRVSLLELLYNLFSERLELISIFTGNTWTKVWAFSSTRGKALAIELQTLRLFAITANTFRLLFQFLFLLTRLFLKLLQPLLWGFHFLLSAILKRIVVLQLVFLLLFKRILYVVRVVLLILVLWVILLLLLLLLVILVSLNVVDDSIKRIVYGR